MTFFRFLFLIPFLLFAGVRAEIAEGNRHVAVELIAPQQTIRAGESFTIGVFFKPDPGWHLYWMNPGDSGLAPRFDWSAPEGTQIGSPHYPAPSRIDTPPLTSYGYSDSVMVVFTVEPPETMRQSTLKLGVQVDYLLCSDVCVPAEAELVLELIVADESQLSPDFYRFEHWLSRLPQSQSDWRIRAVTRESHVQLVLEPPPGESLSSIAKLEFFPEQGGWMDHSARQFWQVSRDRLLLDLPLNSLGQPAPERIRGVLVTDAEWQGQGFESAWVVDTALEGDRSSGTSLRILGGLVGVGIVLLIVVRLLRFHQNRKKDREID
ncbi:hypothetical protein JW992_07650 [candidate division KSB1 bacterium]|nr:hypothetical protein [candidate division KSB1 bacterium]